MYTRNGTIEYMLLCVDRTGHMFSLIFSQHNKYLDRTEDVKNQELVNINTILLNLMNH